MAANIYQAVKQAMQDLVAPQLEALKGEITTVRGDIGGLRTDVRRVEETLTSEIRRVDEKLSGEIRRVDDKLSAEIHRIDEKLTWALDLRERIVVLEARAGISPERS